MKIRIEHEVKPKVSPTSAGNLKLGDMFRLSDDTSRPDPCMFMGRARNALVQYWDFVENRMVTIAGHEKVIPIKCVLTYIEDDATDNEGENE